MHTCGHPPVCHLNVFFYWLLSAVISVISLIKKKKDEKWESFLNIHASSCMCVCIATYVFYACVYVVVHTYIAETLE